jgi:hypothetical protein
MKKREERKSTELKRLQEECGVWYLRDAEVCALLRKSTYLTRISKYSQYFGLTDLGSVAFHCQKQNPEVTLTEKANESIIS